MKKIKKYIIGLFIILVLFILILIILINNPVDKKIRYIYNEKKQGNIEVMPNNISDLFMKYIGRNEQRSVCKAMYNFVSEVVEKYYLNTQNLNDEKARDYYNKNKENIEKELGITEENEFINFLDCMKKLNGSELILKEYTINPNTLKNQSGYTEFVLLVTYEENDTIGFKLKLLNSVDTNKTPIIYNGGITEEDLSYEYVPNDYVSPINSPGKVIN